MERLPIRLFAALCCLVAVVACDDGRTPPDDAQLATEVLRAQAGGLALLQQDRLEEARAEFLRLTELAPEQAAGPANLALVELRGGDFELAERHVRDALSREPDDVAVRLILAKVLEAQGRTVESAEERERVLEVDPGNLRALWALSGGASDAEGFRSAPDRVARLTRVIEAAPANLPARLELVEAHLGTGAADEAAVQLEEFRALTPVFPQGGEAAFDLALRSARALDAETAAEAARRLHDLMRTTSVYQAGLERLRGPLGEATGFASLAFSHELRLEVPDQAAVLAALRFRDATDFSQLGALDVSGGEPVEAVGDFDADGDQDLFVWLPSSQGGRGYLLRNDLGRFTDVTPDDVRSVQEVRAATFSDVDSDGLSDLYLLRAGPNRLFRQLASGQLQDISEASGAADDGVGIASIFADVDHDGDLDLFVANQGSARLYRNDGAGRFSLVPGSMGLPEDGSVVDVDFGDFDGDGDLDLLMATGDGVRLMANQRQDVFSAVEGAFDDDGAPATALAVGDYDHDGFPDVAVGRSGSALTLYRGREDGRFSLDRRSETALPGRTTGDVRFLDFDNDGSLDLAASVPNGVALLRNDGFGVFQDFSAILPANLEDFSEVSSLHVLDYNEDGDLDLLAGSPAGLRLLRNDGGHLNHHMSLNLVARGPGSGKVNRFGVGSRVEVRAGDLYQSITVRGPTTLIGLGSHLKADVIRIVWTNGVPQYLYFPGTDQDLIESQELKGSCAFVYAWDGEKYEFVADAMWRSALGMPLGIMGGGATSEKRVYAPPAASREFLRIPGDALRAREGTYRLKITEELWEVAYVDEVKLLAIDHPDSVELFVDEKFVPPAAPHLALFRVAERILPGAAWDGEGTDVWETLAEKDARYVSDLRVRRYQGIVAPHEIILEVPEVVVEEPHPYLFLQGWIFPSDASINVAVFQSDEAPARSPRLDVPDGRGGWRTAIANIGFPSGKDKTVVVDLSGVIQRQDPRVRIRTNMQVYWDHAFFAVGDVAGPAVATDAENAVARLGGSGSVVELDDLRVQLLRPQAADLHFRGFSREYRKGGRHGPHWFDYGDVTEEARWLPIQGVYTRYGDVGPLLAALDDMYSVMAPGDEMTVEFDAAIKPVPEGWTRTFLLYTDGWIKDADMNTATGNTVDPLPFHDQSVYPYGGSEVYPTDAEHRRYLERYQTREVDRSMRGLASSIQR